MSFKSFHCGAVQQSNFIESSTGIGHDSIYFFLVRRIQVSNDTLTITYLPYLISGITINHSISSKALSRFGFQFIK